VTHPTATILAAVAVSVSADTSNDSRMPTDANAPFLFLSIRAEDPAADDEYQAIMRFAGLDDSEMQRIRLTHRSLGVIHLDDWSGVILGGGPYNASDPQDSKSSTQQRVETELMSLIDRIVEADFPFLGCCYGVGMLGSVIGATVDRSHPEPVAAVTVTLTAAGREDPLFAELPDVFDAFGGHKEAASSLPSDAVCLASSPDCPIQAFRVGTNTYATQFHPELDLQGILTRIDVYKTYGYFAPESAESLKTAARQRHIEYPPTILKRFVERYSRLR
jgi:GMP synthase (glutamine-hydrolysing)